MQLNLDNYASVPDFFYGITREIWEDGAPAATADMGISANPWRADFCDGEEPLQPDLQQGDRRVSGD